MAPERKKSQTKFGISPFISPKILPTHNLNSVSDVSNVFIVLSPCTDPNHRKKEEAGGSMPYRCVYPLLPGLKIPFKYCAYLPGRISAHLGMPHGSQVRAALLLSFSHVKLKLLFSDVKVDRCTLGKPAHRRHMAI